MDARWGFHQLKLHDETRKVFTLVTPFGTYCYNRMVMGWINATAEFQRHMNVTMGDALWRCAIVMVDDICVGPSTLDEHIQQLEEVFSRLAACTRSLAQAEQGEAASAGRRVPRAHQYSGGSQNNTWPAQSYLGDAIPGE